MRIATYSWLRERLLLASAATEDACNRFGVSKWPADALDRLATRLELRLCQLLMPEVMCEIKDNAVWIREAEPMTNDRLLTYAETHRPPQSWYDETENPFEPRGK